MENLDRIWVDSERQGGRSCVKGTRIPVGAVLELVAAGISSGEIIKRYYPSLSEEDIRACIEYAKFLVENEEIYFVGEGR